MKLTWVEKTLLVSMFLVLVIGIIDHSSAQEQQTLGNFVQNTCISLPQTCSNCTYVNITKISLVRPESVIFQKGDFLMTKSDTTYNYTFCNTSKLGEYIVDWKADLNGKTVTGNYNFLVTLLGAQPTTAQGTIYFFLGILSILIFGLSLYGAIKIKWKHPRNQKGEIIGINDLKYVKLLLWFFTYLMLIFITFAFKHVSRLADWDVAANWLNWIFWFFIVWMLPIFIITVFMFIKAIVDAKKIDDLLRRGLSAK